MGKSLSEYKTVRENVSAHSFAYSCALGQNQKSIVGHFAVVFEQIERRPMIEFVHKLCRIFFL